jgi:hypothetical protein
MRSKSQPEIVRTFSSAAPPTSLLARTPDVATGRSGVEEILKSTPAACRSA